MNVDRVLEVINHHAVGFILIGGMNFLFRHVPVTTFDVDLWIDDHAENRQRCEVALAELAAEWGPTEALWRPVAEAPPGWLERQQVFCLTSPHGAIDIFRSVRGLDSWANCRARAENRTTASGIAYTSLSDEDMLKCQLALPEGERKLDRIRILRQSLERASHEHRTG